MINNISTQKEGYWDRFYGGQNADRPPIPSQFAAFIAQECASCEQIIEIGCGNGRDSFFFAQHGMKVTAFDGSKVATEHGNAMAMRLGLSVQFIHANVATEAFRKALAETVSSTSQTVLYARFFLHAITDEEQSIFLRAVADNLKQHDRIAFEYRTSRDAVLEKVTQSHFRRFIRPPALFATAADLGLTVEYDVEGYGFAKYKQDDAYVARCILRKQ